jgi:RNA polymerase sigma factor (sigma-70 family)
MKKTKKNEVTNQQLVDAFQNPDNRNIIRDVCNQYRTILSTDVLRTCGLNGLWKCLEKHDDKLGSKFTTSLYQFVDWQCKKQVRTSSQSDAPTEHAFDIEDCTTPVLDRIIIRECIDALPDNYRFVIIGKFFEGKSNAEMGRELGCSRENVGQLLKRALSAVRTIYLGD